MLTNNVLRILFSLQVGKADFHGDSLTGDVGSLKKWFKFFINIWKTWLLDPNYDVEHKLLLFYCLYVSTSKNVIPFQANQLEVEIIYFIR